MSKGGLEEAGSGRARRIMGEGRLSQSVLTESLEWRLKAGVVASSPHSLNYWGGGVRGGGGGLCMLLPSQPTLEKQRGVGERT